MEHETNGGRHDLAETPSGDLLKQLADEARILVRNETELAKLELAGVAGDAKGAGITLAVGLIALSIALLVLTATAILLLSLVLPSWAAGLIVFGVLALAGTITTLEAARKIGDLEERPKKVLRALSQDARWMKDTVKTMSLHRHLRRN